MKELLETIVRSLIEHPEQARITEIIGEKTVVLELRCAKGDLGKIIGKGGKTVGSIRTLLNAVASREGRRAILEVVE